MTLSPKIGDEIAASDCVMCRWLWSMWQVDDMQDGDRLKTAALHALNEHRQRHHPGPVKWRDVKD